MLAPAHGLDPQPRGIDDLKQRFAGIDDLPADRGRAAEHAGRRRLHRDTSVQPFRHCRTTCPKAIEFGPRFRDLAGGNAAGKCGQPLCALLGNADLAVELG
jgi:hypothetical protein